MLNWNLENYEQYRKELIEQAEHDQLARDVLSERRKFNPALAWVGQRMVDIGSKLVSMSADDDESNPHGVSLN
ncbi:MAG: hypothetical protein IAE80_12070 [Anaerolinea sp.]|nr:hypothetical protein [Anaerolinea sp.]